MKMDQEKIDDNETTASNLFGVAEEPKVPSVRKRRTRIEVQSSALKVALPEDVSNLVSATLSTLKERGRDIRAEELLHSVFTMITQKRLDQLLLEHTPDEYYLQRARELPELHAALIKQAKHAVLRGEHPPKAKKSAVRHPKDIDPSSTSSPKGIGGNQ